MTNRITRRGIPINDNAARLGSGGGEGPDQHLYNNMTAPAAQHRCMTMPDQGANTERRVEQLRLFALDGVLSEPYVPARAGNDAAMSAAMRVGRAQ